MKLQTANILLSLGGDHGNTIPKFAVTAAEIAVLRAIHGEDAVQDVEPLGTVERSNRDERTRLVFTYGAAKTHDQKPIVEGMFPGVAARVFETLDELDLDPSFYKATGRLKADSVVREPTVAEYVAAGYKASTYRYTKSTPEEIAAAVAAEQPAPEAEPKPEPDAPAHDAEVDEHDGIGDMTDEHAENVLG